MAGALAVAALATGAGAGLAEGFTLAGAAEGLLAGLLAEGLEGFTGVLDGGLTGEMDLDAGWGFLGVGFADFCGWGDLVGAGFAGLVALTGLAALAGGGLALPGLAFLAGGLGGEAGLRVDFAMWFLGFKS